MISVAPTGNKLVPSPNPNLDLANLTVDDLTEYELTIATSNFAIVRATSGRAQQRQFLAKVRQAINLRQ